MGRTPSTTTWASDPETGAARKPSAWPLRWLLVLLAVLIVFLLNARVGLP